MFQETWLRVVRHLPEKADRENLKPWIFMIALNLHRDLLRKKRIRRLFLLSRGGREADRISLAAGPAAAGSDPALTAERASTWRNISRAVSGLPEKQRRVFVLKEVEGFQQAEIAQMLGIPVGTVKSLLHRALKRLQRELTPFNPGGRKVKCDAKMLSV